MKGALGNSVGGEHFKVKVPCLWQVFDNTPAALEGTLAAGDEITGVNGKAVKGKTKVEVAKMIQAVQVRSPWPITGLGMTCSIPEPVPLTVPYPHCVPCSYWFLLFSGLVTWQTLISKVMSAGHQGLGWDFVWHRARESVQGAGGH